MNVNKRLRQSFARSKQKWGWKWPKIFPVWKMTRFHRSNNMKIVQRKTGDWCQAEDMYAWVVFNLFIAIIDIIPIRKDFSLNQYNSSNQFIHNPLCTSQGSWKYENQLNVLLPAGIESRGEQERQNVRDICDEYWIFWTIGTEWSDNCRFSGDRGWKYR